jgi:hypothetical protein
LQDQGNPEGRQDGGQGVSAEKWSQGADLQSGAEHGDDEGRGQKGQPEIAGEGHGSGAREAAQHHQIPVGKVDDIHDAEDQGQPRRDEGQDHPIDDPVDCLNHEGVHWLRSLDTDG